MTSKIEPKPLLLIKPFDEPRPEPLKFSFPKPPEKDPSVNLGGFDGKLLTQLKSPPLSPAIKALSFNDLKLS